MQIVVSDDPEDWMVLRDSVNNGRLLVSFKTGAFLRDF